MEINYSRDSIPQGYEESYRAHHFAKLLAMQLLSGNNNEDSGRVPRAMTPSRGSRFRLPQQKNFGAISLLFMDWMVSAEKK